MKKNLILIELLIIMLSIYVFIYLILNIHNTIAFEENDNISIFGYVLDKDEKPVSEVKVTVKDNSGNEYDDKTDEYGYYCIGNLYKEFEYEIIYNYNNSNYNEVKEAKAQQFKKCNDRSEVIFLYNSKKYKDKDKDKIKENIQEQINIIWC